MQHVAMTMTHLDEGTLQALLDDELPAAKRAAAEEHLRGCRSCALELGALRSAATELTAVLPLIDRPAPVLRAQAAVLRERRRSGRAGRISRALARAAVLVLGLGLAGVAAAAIPGSPIREWFRDFARSDAPAAAVEQSPDLPPATVAVSATEPAPAGVSVPPADGRIRVGIESPGRDLLVRVGFTDRPQAQVLAIGPAAAARFRTGPGRVVVAGAGEGEIRIQLPRSAAHASVEVDGRLYLLREGTQLRVLGPAADSAGSEIIFRAGP